MSRAAGGAPRCAKSATRRVRSRRRRVGEAERVDVEASLRIDDGAADLAVLHGNRWQRERPRLAEMIDLGPAPVLVEDLPRPLHAGHRERLRLHLVAAVLDGAAPTLLLGEHRRRDGSGQRGDQHREDDRGAARSASSQRQPSLDHFAVGERQRDPDRTREPRARPAPATDRAIAPSASR